LQSEAPQLASIRDDLPKPVCDLVHRMMAKDPRQRYASASEVLADVKALMRAVKAGDVDNVQLSKLAGPVVDNSFETKHPAWALTLLCLLVACIGGGMGWALRAGDPLATPVPEDVLIPRAASAREQYLQAMLSGVEEGFLAVKRNFPQDKEWVYRAEEQLMLILLRDASRREEAKKQSINLFSLGSVDERFRHESRVADAWLLASGNEGEKTQARRIIGTLKPIEDQLNDTWRNLLVEAEMLLERGPPPPQGPPSGPLPNPDEAGPGTEESQSEQESSAAGQF
jgi:serine/threonine-protein kinase